MADKPVIHPLQYCICDPAKRGPDPQLMRHENAKNARQRKPIAVVGDHEVRSRQVRKLLQPGLFLLDPDQDFRNCCDKAQNSKGTVFVIAYPVTG